jgi:ribosome biogenesis GTPase / thiamine phosphate phosphatase
MKHSIFPSNPTGIIYQKSNALFCVYKDGFFYSCNLARSSVVQSKRQGKISNNSIDPVVGDYVTLLESEAGSGLITRILPRRNQISRRAPLPNHGAHAFEQVIAANIDQVVIVFSADRPAPHWNLLDRYLVQAEAAGIPALICITKTDLLVERIDLEGEMQTYLHLGYPLFYTSSQDGSGIAELNQKLSGQVSILMGKSGVGKSSLINTLQPGLDQRVNTVSRESGKGKHTTSDVRMFNLDSGGAIIDTPGIRELALWDINNAELAYYFPEMRPFIGQCKFRADCNHEDEPGCAIRKAVMANKISPRRYQSYLRIKEDELFE